MVALIAGGGLLLVGLGHLKKSVVIPATLGGIDRSADPSLNAQAAKVRASLAAELKGTASGVGVYGFTQYGELVVLAVSRGGGDPAQFFAHQTGVTKMSEPFMVGPDTCVTAGEVVFTECVRGGKRLLVLVIDSHNDSQHTATLLDEAWVLQPA